MAAREENTDLTQCPVCFEPYTETGDYIPRILPCHCTLCQSCILKLIKNEQLECPQDRKKHPARREEKSFPQNKYILSFLRKEFQPKETDYDVCPEHNQKMMLFCKDDKCQKAICPICMTEGHLSHSFRNVIEEHKKQLYSKLEPLIENIHSYREELQRAKQQISKDCEKKIKKLTERKEEVMAELDEKLSSCEDNVATLSDIREKIEKGSTHQELMDKLEFMNVMKDLCADAKEPVKVKFYELAESEQEVEKAEEDLEEKTGKIGEKIPVYIGHAKKICKVKGDDVEALEVLSDESVAVVRKISSDYNTTYSLTRYDKDTGEILYDRALKDWARGMAEVNLGGKPTLVLSYKATKDSKGNISSPATLKFLEVPHLYKCIRIMQTDVQIERMCRSLKGSGVLGQIEGNRKRLYSIDCTEAPPKSGVIVVLSEDSPLHDMCFTRDLKDNLIVVCIYNGVLFAEDMRGNVVWSVEGAIGGKLPINCYFVTCDQRGHIFVCDTSNKCIETFSVEGLHLGTLLSKGEHGIIIPVRVRWCEKSSSLVVVHGGSNLWSVPHLGSNNSWSVTHLGSNNSWSVTHLGLNNSWSVTALKIHYR